MQIDEEELKTAIAKKLKFFRTQTQEVLAEQAQISVDTMSAAERGKVIINSSTLIKLCNALEVTPNDILEDFITNKPKIINEKINNEITSLTNEEKLFVLEVINFIKSHRSNK